MGVQLVWDNKVALVLENNTLMIWGIKANRYIRSVERYANEISEEMFNGYINALRS